MESYRTDLLLAASRLLSYPTDEDKRDIMDCIDGMETDYEMKLRAQTAAEAIYEVTLKERMEIYVSAFDLQKELGLYLTAHEFGDSPKRGAALIRLQKIINQAGYERIDSELADYMPLLFEFTAVAGEHKDRERLVQRLGAVTQRILNQLQEDHPYYPLFALLMSSVFEPPTKEELEKIEFNREEADLEELPYPIMYK